MGIIKAAIGAIGGGLADQWLEVIEADSMSEGVVLTKGVAVRKDDRRSGNRKGTEDYISDGSIINVNENQFMMLVDGGKIVDYTTEPGYFKVDNKAAPSLFNGGFMDSLKETFSRFKYGGVPSGKQEVFFVNLQEIKGIKFGTPSPLNYYDEFYNAELFLRAFGNYSIKITDPILFYKEACPRDKKRVHIDEINEQYLSEFLEALQTSITKMSAEGVRISHIGSKITELSKHMSEVLDNSWKANRGMEIQSVGIASVSYDDESKELINMRNRGAMLSDPNVREGFVQSSIAKGLEAAGSNPAGAGMAFMGMGVGMNAGGGYMGQASQTNMQQMQQQAQAKQQTQVQAQAGQWFCAECGTKNSGKFCTNCGTQQPASKANACPNCGNAITGSPKFCSSCGHKLQ